MSAEKIKKYQPRAPRYVLSFKDNSVLRFAAYETGSKKWNTKIFNLSETGLAFILPMMDNPKMDEVIKIQFEAPHCPSIACFAKIVRISKHRIWDNYRNPQTFKMIAVQFVDLPQKQRDMIRAGLSQEFKKQRRQFQIEQNLRKLQWLFFSAIDVPLKKANKLIKKFKGSKKRAEKYVDEA